MKAAGGGRKEIEGGLVDCSGVVESRLVVASTCTNMAEEGRGVKIQLELECSWGLAWR